MKILDKPSQILNVRNTTSQCHSHQVHQTKTKYPNQNTKYAKQDTKYAKQNTKYAKQNTKYAKQNTKYTKQNTKYAKQNAKYAKQNTKYTKYAISLKTNVNLHTKILIYAVLPREIFVENLRISWRTFYRPKKYGGVPKMTNLRYACHWKV